MMLGGSVKWGMWEAGVRQTLESPLPSVTALNEPPSISEILLSHWQKEPNETSVQS